MEISLGCRWFPHCLRLFQNDRRVPVLGGLWNQDGRVQYYTPSKIRAPPPHSFPSAATTLLPPKASSSEWKIGSLGCFRQKVPVERKQKSGRWCRITISLAQNGLNHQYRSPCQRKSGRILPWQTASIDSYRSAHFFSVYEKRYSQCQGVSRPHSGEFGHVGEIMFQCLVFGPWLQRIRFSSSVHQSFPLLR